MEALFNPHKATQIVSHLLCLNGEILNYTKAIKLVYIADRTFLDKYKLPISFDEYSSMDNGPVVSHIYGLIKGSVSNDYWIDHIVKSGYNICLKQKPEFDLLSKIEKDTLNEVDRIFKSYDFGSLIDYTHKFREWKDPEGSSLTIHLKEILGVLGKKEDEIKEIEEDLEYMKTLKHVFNITSL